MISRVPKRPPFFARFIGGLIIFETLGFAGAYFVWNKLNNSREFREKTKKSAPWALEMYYKMGETMSDKNKVIREADYKVWNKSD